MDVQILSRFLEAKLTVCQCLFGEYTNVGSNMCTYMFIVYEKFNYYYFAG